MAHTDLDAHMPLSTNSGPGRLEKKHLMRIALLLIIHHSMHGLPATRLSEHMLLPQCHWGTSVYVGYKYCCSNPAPIKLGIGSLGQGAAAAGLFRCTYCRPGCATQLLTAINTGGLSIKLMQGKPTQNALQSKTTGRAIQPKSRKLAGH